MPKGRCGFVSGPGSAGWNAILSQDERGLDNDRIKMWNKLKEVLIDKEEAEIR